MNVLINAKDLQEDDANRLRSAANELIQNGRNQRDDLIGLVDKAL